MRFLVALAISLLVHQVADGLIAAERVSPTVVTQDLLTPWGVAIQLSTNAPYIADSGRGRIVRVVDGKLEEVVVGFATEPFQHEPQRQVGPMSLAFLTPSELLVATAGAGPNRDALYVVSVPPAGSPPLHAKDALRITSVPREAKQGDAIWSDMPAMAASLESGILVLLHGQRSQAGLIGIAIAQPEQLNRASGYGRASFRHLPSADSATSQQAWGLTRGERGEWVIGYAAPALATGLANDTSAAAPPEKPRTSTLRFLRATDGQQLLELTLDLPNLIALQFVPGGAANLGGSTLLALDHGGPTDDSEGLYRVDATLENGKLAARAVRLAQCTRPVSITLGSLEESAVYVTSWGPRDATPETPVGQLLRIPLSQPSK